MAIIFSCFILGEKGAYSVVSCSILKEPYIRQFGKFNDIYGQSLSFLIERSIFYLNDVSDNADMHIIAEMRGKQQDQSLLNYYNRLRDVGTHWITALCWEGKKVLVDEGCRWIDR